MEKRNTTHETWIYDVSEEYRPPVQHVLGVEVQDDVVFLMIADYSETYDTFTYKNIATVCVDTKTLLHAIGFQWLDLKCDNYEPTEDLRKELSFYKATVRAWEHKRETRKWWKRVKSWLKRG